MIAVVPITAVMPERLRTDTVTVQVWCDTCFLERTLSFKGWWQEHSFKWPNAGPLVIEEITWVKDCEQGSWGECGKGIVLDKDDHLTVNARWEPVYRAEPSVGC